MSESPRVRMPPAPETARLLLSQTLSLEHAPWLADHAIAGVPTLPGCIALELLAQAGARLWGRPPEGLSDVRFESPVQILSGGCTTIRVVCRPLPGPQGVELSLESQKPRRSHVRAKLDSTAWKAAPRIPSPGVGNPIAHREEIYRRPDLGFPIGPSFRVLEGILSVSENEVLSLFAAPPEPLQLGNRRATMFCPLLVEAAFHTCHHLNRRYSSKWLTTPYSISRVRMRPGAWDRARKGSLVLRAVHRGSPAGGQSSYDVIAYDSEGRLWMELLDYSCVEVFFGVFAR